MSIFESVDQLMAHIAAVAGKTPELTIRGPRAFTFSYETVEREAADKLVAYFSPLARVSVEHDAECGTFIYLDV